MYKIYINLLLLILFTFLINCTFGPGKRVWNDLSKDLETVKNTENTKLIFSTSQKFNQEITSNKKLVIKSKPLKNLNWNQQNLSNGNYIPHLSYQNKINLIFQSKKIGKNSFDIKNIDFQPIIENNVAFLYDPNGTLFSYSIENERLIWKYNFYKKRYKNLPKEINLYLTSSSLIATDNLGFVYSLDKSTGAIEWAKSYGVPFKSNIKVDESNVFLLNQDNKFYVIGEKNGEQRTDLETIPSFLKSNIKSNISLDSKQKNVFFITSAAEIYSLNYFNRNINWLLNLTLAGTDKQIDLFYSSPIVYSDNQIFLSTSFSSFLMGSKDGSLIWEFPFSTKVAPIVLEKYIFLVSKEGLLICLDREKGKVIWSKNIFKTSEKLKYNKTGYLTSMFLVSNKIFITTQNGYFLFFDYQNGEIINYAKVSKGFFSKPTIINESIFIIDNKMRILKFN